MKKRKSITVGDVFAIKIEDIEYYYFGRVLFDVKKQYSAEEKLFNYLDWHGESVLIETYKTISKKPEISSYDIAVNGQFIPKSYLLEEDLTIIGNVPVDPHKVSFPETYKNVHLQPILFTVGELALATPLSIEYVDKTKIFPTMGNIYKIQSATLDYAGRKDLIEDEEDIMDNYFKFSDLRSLPDVRKEVYKSIGENPNQTYSELALKHGFDLARFY